VETAADSRRWGSVSSRGTIAWSKLRSTDNTRTYRPIRSFSSGWMHAAASCHSSLLGCHFTALNAHLNTLLLVVPPARPSVAPLGAATPPIGCATDMQRTAPHTGRITRFFRVGSRLPEATPATLRGGLVGEAGNNGLLPKGTGKKNHISASWRYDASGVLGVCLCWGGIGTGGRQTGPRHWRCGGVRTIQRFAPILAEWVSFLHVCFVYVCVASEMSNGCCK
jgi:hypothetical protein